MGPEQPPYAGAVTAPWQAGLETDTLGMLVTACGREGIDLHHMFLQYSNGSEFMLASQFYTLAWRAMLLEDSNNVDDFFKMALGRPYCASFGFGVDRFMSALARICDNLSFTQEVPIRDTVQIVVDKHLKTLRLGVMPPLGRHARTLTWRAPLHHPANAGLYTNRAN